MGEYLLKTDLLVVGGSVSGCACAKEASKNGLDVAVVEEHGIVGKQRKCTTIVSRKGLEEIGADYGKSVLNKIRGARIIAGDYGTVVESSVVQAFVLDRQKFDEECAREAVDAGAKIFLNSRATAFAEHANGLKVSAGKKFFDAKIVVGADGATSTTAALNSFPQISKFVLCYEAEYENAMVEDRRRVDVFLDAESCRGFFGWIVPCGEETVRVGFGTSDFKKIGLRKKKFFEKKAIAECLKKARKKREFHALIPVTVREATQNGRFLLVGDAAGQTKATTGGGIVFGSLCAKEAARACARNLLNGEELSYERAWRKKYGGVLGLHEKLRCSMNLFGNGLNEWLVSSMNLGFNRVLSRVGDMDFVADFFRK